MTTRLLRAVAVAVAVVSAVLLAAAHVMGGGRSDLVLGAGWPIPNILVGLLLTVRRPRLVPGWIFAGIGLFAGLSEAGRVAAEVASPDAAGRFPWWAVTGAWLDTFAWIPLVYSTLILLPMLFPDGRAHTPRWRWVVRAAVLVMSAGTLVASLQASLAMGSGREVPNPVGIGGFGDIEQGWTGAVLFAVTAVMLALALTALILRFRRSRGVERAQLKWFTSSAVLLIAGFVLQGWVEGLVGARLELVDVALFALTPTAAAVAVLRYRLYAIDRIISRTVTYALVTALLVAVYAAAVTVLTATTATAMGQSPVAVAAATLAAAALFRPARRRIQGVVDRRFNRAHYDASRTVESFRSRLRDEVDIDRLTTDLIATTNQALQPQATAVWLRFPGASA